jgi:hypothetical protein
MDLPKSTRELLDKYWEAETSSEEERILRDQLSQDDEGVLGTYFRFLKEESARTMQKQVRPVAKTRHIPLRRAISIAASIVILVGAGIYIQRSMIGQMQPATADTYQDPHEAYEEAKEALFLVSAKFNKSRIQAEEKLSKTRPYVDILK